MFTADSSVVSYRQPGYGNWRRPRTVGIANLSMPATLMLLGVIGVAVLVLLVRGLIAGLVTFVVGFVLIELLSVRLPSGFTPAGRVALSVKYWGLKSKGANVHIGGVLSRHRPGKLLLPGVGADLTVSEHEDTYGRRFALVKHGKTGLYSVAFECSPDGLALVDPQQVDLWVARWGEFLADLGYEAGLAGAQVVVETSPDTGARLRREVTARMVAAAPVVARETLNEVLDTYPAGSAQVSAYVTLTYESALRAGGKARGLKEMSHDVAARLPGLTSALATTGAGTATPLTVADLCRIVRVAYDPDSADLFAAAQVSGEKPDITWDDVGPVSAVSNWKSYRHDGARSVSWEMIQAPRGVVRSDVLSGLLAPNSNFLRKRVTMLYKPHPAGDAAKTVDDDERHAEAAAASATRNKARLAQERAAAAKAAAEEAAGAGLEEFGMVMTVTVRPDADMADVAALADSLAATSRLRLRLCYGQQDSVFALALPLGLIPAKYSMVPEVLTRAVA